MRVFDCEVDGIDECHLIGKKVCTTQMEFKNKELHLLVAISLSATASELEPVSLVEKRRWKSNARHFIYVSVCLFRNILLGSH
jgi:hypothetical protein